MAKKEFPEGFVEALTWLCNSYDAENGEYPESHYEGNALLRYYFETQQEGKRMKSIEKEAKVLEAKPHDIAAIPAASLWELCRDFDAEAGMQDGKDFAGLRIFRHFKHLMETRRVSHDTKPEVAAEMEVTLEAFAEVVRRILKEDVSRVFRRYLV